VRLVDLWGERVCAAVGTGLTLVVRARERCPDVALPRSQADGRAGLSRSGVLKDRGAVASAEANKCGDIGRAGFPQDG